MQRIVPIDIIVSVYLINVWLKVVNGYIQNFIFNNNFFIIKTLMNLVGSYLYVSYLKTWIFGFVIWLLSRRFK